MGSTAPSRMGFRNLLTCQLVASGPVSDSPSPTTAATIRSGLSNAAPQAWDRTYPSSPPSWMLPGVSGVQWLPIPPGKENCRKNRSIPSSSSEQSGFSGEAGAGARAGADALIEAAAWASVGGAFGAVVVGDIAGFLSG